MQKNEAIKLLGDSTAAAAEAIGITVQAVGQWPDVLPPRIADRVYAALARKAGALPELAAPQQKQAQAATETVAVTVTAMPSSAYEKRPEYVADMRAGLVTDERVAKKDRRKEQIEIDRRVGDVKA